MTGEAANIIGMDRKAKAEADTPPPAPSRSRARLRLLYPATSALRFIIAVGRDVREADLPLRASGLVYTTLLSLAPMLALSFSVLKGLGVHNALEPFLQGLFAPLGEQSVEIAQRIVGFVSNVQVGVLGAIGLVALLWGVIGLMSRIENAFNVVWRVTRARPFAVKVRDYLFVLLIGPLLMFLSVALTAAAENAETLTRWLGPTHAVSVAEALGQGVAWGLFAAAFTALYMFMPYTRVRFVPALLAGVFAGALWKAMGWLFGVFVAGSASYAAIYSAFATLILFMIWLQTGWLIVLVGASAAYYLQNPSNQSLSRRAPPLGPRALELIALRLCAEVGADFYDGAPPPHARDLSARLSLPVLSIEDAARDLVANGILARTAGEGFIPGCPFDTVTVAEMLSRLGRDDSMRAPDRDGLRAAVAKQLDALVKAQETAGATTLKTLSTGKEEK